MGKIIVLDENTANKIAAGEVIEKPASVVKELVENSLDAGATSISVEIKNGGISYIKVSDNGSGIFEDDIEMAFERHGTSKIISADDLESIKTMGFRGEALASIAAVSTVELTTKVQDSEYGTYIMIQGGQIKEVKKIGCPNGTTFVVKDLFYNTPARYKFLKRDSTEAGYISDIVSRIALGNPHISMKFVNNGSVVVHSPGNNDILSAIFSVYGKDIAREVIEVSFEDKKLSIKGYIGKPDIARASRNHQSVFINNRYIRSRIVSAAVDEAYKTFLMRRKFPFMVLNLEINPTCVDVNVHPTKMEVRFSDEQEIFRSVYYAVNSALLNRPRPKAFSQESVFNSTKSNYESSKNSYENNIKNNYENFKINEALEFNQYEQQRLNQLTVDRGQDQDQLTEDRGQDKDQFTVDRGQRIVENQSGSFNYFDRPRDFANDNSSLENSGNPKFFEEDNKDQDIINRNNKDQEFTSDIKENTCYTSCVRDIVKNEIFSDVRIIGQVFSTYILLENDGEMLLIDQHAAHERIMYERLKRSLKEQKSYSQIMLYPLVIQLTHLEIKKLLEEVEFFKKMGFVYEDFGNNSIILREVPFIDETNMVKELFLRLLDSIIDLGNRPSNLIEDEKLYDIACKSALKGNRKLDELEIQSILKELSTLENPFNCPHGRPTIIKITRHDLEKMFKRIL